MGSPSQRKAEFQSQTTRDTNNKRRAVMSLQSHKSTTIASTVGNNPIDFVETHSAFTLEDRKASQDSCPAKTQRHNISADIGHTCASSPSPRNPQVSVSRLRIGTG
eukprot:472677-Amphidinium_carterae.1